MRLEAEFHFAAAHRLPFYDGPCFRMHGHNYRLIVGVDGTPDAKSGMGIDFVQGFVVGRPEPLSMVPSPV